MSDSPTIPPSGTIKERLGRAKNSVQSRVERQRRRLDRRLENQAQEVGHRIDRTMRRVEREMRRTSHRVKRGVGDLGFELSERRERLEEGFEDLTWQTGRWVRTHPTQALLGAFGIGLLFGLSAAVCCRSARDR